MGAGARIYFDVSPIRIHKVSDFKTRYFISFYSHAGIMAASEPPTRTDTLECFFLLEKRYTCRAKGESISRGKEMLHLEFAFRDSHEKGGHGGIKGKEG